MDVDRGRFCKRRPGEVQYSFKHNIASTHDLPAQKNETFIRVAYLKRKLGVVSAKT